MSGAPVDAFGHSAPFLGHCGIRRLDWGNGEARSQITMEPHLGNRTGAAHGGLLMTLLDSVMAGAARSAQAEDHGVMTIDMQVAFLSPGRGTLTGHGKVLRNGGSLVYCEGTVTDEAGALVCRATGMFRPRRPPRRPTSEAQPG
jgi:uncharacterized protein (TIGR00369 family)